MTDDARPTRDVQIRFDDYDPSAVTPAASRSGDLRARFRELADRWTEDTEFTSSATAMLDHPAYRSIIELGADVVPILLDELRERPDHWFWALEVLTGQNPVPDDASFDDAVTHWLEWGRRYGQPR